MIRVQIAIMAKVKNNVSLFQKKNAVNRQSSASMDRGSRDQSNMRDKSLWYLVEIEAEQILIGFLQRCMNDEGF